MHGGRKVDMFKNQLNFLHNIYRIILKTLAIKNFCTCFSYARYQLPELQDVEIDTGIIARYRYANFLTMNFIDISNYLKKTVCMENVSILDIHFIRNLMAK